jgi:hypothetical protein
MILPSSAELAGVLQQLCERLAKEIARRAAEDGNVEHHAKAVLLAWFLGIEEDVDDPERAVDPYPLP